MEAIVKPFKTFLVENNVNPLNLKDGQSIFEFIMKNCQQWFNEIDAPKFQNKVEFVEWLIKNKYSLYRSVGDLARGTYINKSFDFRVPKDTPPLIQELIDDALQKLGFTTLRKNSLFCTNSIQQAWNYAKKESSPFLVFPMDGYKYLYSEVIYDLYDILKYKSLRNYLNIFKNEEKVREYFDQFREKETNTSLVNFLLFLRDSWLNQIDISNLLEIDPVKFNEEFRFTDKNIKQYVLHEPPRECEIMFRPSIILTHYKELEI